MSLLPHGAVIVRLFSPVSCRFCGLPSRHVEGHGFGPRPPAPGDPAFEVALGERRRGLWALLDDPAFVRCLGTMNAPLLHQIERDREAGRHEGPRNSRARSRERLLYRFVSRFATRNDVTGMAGSTLWARFDEDADENLRVSAGAGAPPRGGAGSPERVRSAYASPAHATYLATTLRRRLAPDECRPRPVARLRLGPDGGEDALTGAAPRLDPADLELALACDGERTVAELCGDDADLRTRLERLVDDGVIERHAPAEPLAPLDARLSRLVGELLALPALSDHPEVRWKLESLLELEAWLREAPARELAEAMRQADELVAGLAPYRPLHPGRTLERLVSAVAREPDCWNGLWLARSGRYAAEGGRLRDRTSGAERPLAADEAALLAAFAASTSSSVADLVARAEAAGAPVDPDTVGRLVDDGVLCVAGADPAVHSSGPAADIAWDAWDRERFMATSLALRDMNLPERYRRPLRMLRSCRAVEQRSEDSAFPTLNPVLAPGDAREALAGLGVEAVDAAKDHAFFMMDSTVPGLDVALGGELRRTVARDLGLLFTLLACRAWEWETSVLLPRLRDAIPVGGRIPLPVVMRSVIGWARAWENPYGDAEFRPRLAVRRDPDGAVRIDDVEAPAGLARWMRDKRIVSTVDLMIAATPEGVRGDAWRLVLNEAHATGDGMPETMHTPWTRAADVPGRGFCTSHVPAVFGQDVLVLQPNVPSKQGASIAWQIRGATMAVRNEGTGTPWEGPTVRVGDLFVERAADGFRVTDGRRAWSLLTASFATGPLRVATFNPGTAAGRLAELAGAPPNVTEEGVTVVPAIHLGRTKVCRRLWVLPPPVVRRRLLEGEGGPAPAGAALLAAAARLRDDVGLPRFLFASLAHEKPFLCDLECLFSLEVLVQSLGGEAAEIRLAEMDPAPGELWLEMDGGPVTSELRFVAAGDGPAWKTGRPVLMDSGG